MLRHTPSIDEGLIDMAKKFRAKRSCPKSGKTCYPNQLEAALAMSGIHSTNKQHRRRKFRTEPTRVYHCSCGSWHLTSRS